MRTRMIQWLDTSGRKMRVKFGVQVLVGKVWHHAHRGGAPLIFNTAREAQLQRAELRKNPAPEVA